MNNKYCYLVYCNKEPIVYAVYSSKKAAIEYALYLLKYREEKAEEKNYEFGFYHYINEEPKGDFRYDLEKIIFSCCLKIPQDISEYGDDKCYIKVVKYPLRSKFNNGQNYHD